VRFAGKALQPGLLTMRHFFGQQQHQKVAVGSVLFLGSIRDLLEDTPGMCQVQPSKQRLQLPFRQIRTFSLPGEVVILILC
jgi:hypothetical protein